MRPAVVRISKLLVRISMVLEGMPKKNEATSDPQIHRTPSYNTTATETTRVPQKQRQGDLGHHTLMTVTEPCPNINGAQKDDKNNNNDRVRAFAELAGGKDKKNVL